MLEDLPPPTLVEDDEGLAALVERLESETEIAVDTEADSFYSYREKVCLLQVSAGGEDWLIDPLADLDLAPLGAMLADPSRIKIFHDGEYDVSILKRDYGFEFASLFDTRVAAAALGMQAPGLAAVINERFGIELDKSMQRSNWAKRPLTQEQISYARLDTRYLVELMHQMKSELAERGRMMIVEGECRRLEQLQPSPVRFNPDEFVRVKGARQLGARERRTLRELFILRDELAAKYDWPLFRVFNNQLLIVLASAHPTTMQRLTAVNGFSSRLARRFGDRVLDCIEDADEMPPLTQLPHLPKKDGTSGMSEEELELYDRLKGWRKGVSDEEGIESAYMLNRHVLLRIAREQPTSSRLLAQVQGMLDWQLDLFGSAIVAVVREFQRALRIGEIDLRGGRRRR